MRECHLKRRKKWKINTLVPHDSKFNYRRVSGGKPDDDDDDDDDATLQRDPSLALTLGAVFPRSVN